MGGSVAEGGHADIEPSGRCDEGAGVPFRIRIGVTGHRSLIDDARIVDRVDEVVHSILDAVPATPETKVHLTVISPLAEGADRLLARAILRYPGARLEAPLPFPPADYCKDFESQPGSVADFLELREEAEYSPAREKLSEERLEDGYQAVGRYVVDRCDVVIAVWDGEPKRGSGGTSEVRERAVARHVPVFHIDSASPHALVEPADQERRERDWDPDRPVKFTAAQAAKDWHDRVGQLTDDFAFVQRYNEFVARGAESWRVRMRNMLIHWWRGRRPPSATGGKGRDAAPVGEATWAANAFARADALANGYQDWYRAGLVAPFVLAVTAVVAVATHTLLYDHDWVAILEAVAIGLLGLVVLVSHRWKWHERYLGYRFLAERLREVPFLALAGVENPQPNPFSPEFSEYASEGWPWRVVDEIWSRRPRPDARESATVPDVERLRDFIATEWICAQKEHHRKTGDRERRTQRRLQGVVRLLFVLTAVAATLHVFALDESEHPAVSRADVLVFLSIALGASGAALSGFGEQRGYRRHADRCVQMVSFLERDEERMRGARTQEMVKRVAEETQRHVLGESRSWFGDVRAEEIELHT